MHFCAPNSAQRLLGLVAVQASDIPRANSRGLWSVNLDTTGVLKPCCGRSVMGEDTKCKYSSSGEAFSLGILMAFR